MTGRLDNFEGAFPLLLIGSVLLVYAAIIANQELASKSTHLPLWGLIGGAGAVIVGAGIYSTFLEPAVPSGSDAQKGWATMPKAEGAPLRPVPRTNGRRSLMTPEPSWWEGPPDLRVAEPGGRTRFAAPRGRAKPTAGPATSVSSAASVGVAPYRPTRAGPRPGPRPPGPRRGSLSELEETITELEAMINRESSSLLRRPATTRPVERGSCADCDRQIPSEPIPSRCSGCGRGLCAGCAASSRAEDGDVRCVECRARAR